MLHDHMFLGETLPTRVDGWAGMAWGPGDDFTKYQKWRFFRVYVPAVAGDFFGGGVFSLT